MSREKATAHTHSEPWHLERKIVERNEQINNNNEERKKREKQGSSLAPIHACIATLLLVLYYYVAFANFFFFFFSHLFIATMYIHNFFFALSCDSRFYCAQMESKPSCPCSHVNFTWCATTCVCAFSNSISIVMNLSQNIFFYISNIHTTDDIVPFSVSLSSSAMVRAAELAASSTTASGGSAKNGVCKLQAYRYTTFVSFFVCVWSRMCMRCVYLWWICVRKIESVYVWACVRSGPLAICHCF